MAEDRVQQLKTMVLDLAMEVGTKEQIMELFMMAALHQDFVLIDKLLAHPSCPFDAAERSEMTAAAEVFRSIAQLCDELDQTPDADVEQKLREVLAGHGVMANNDIEEQAAVATRDLLSKFQLH